MRRVGQKYHVFVEYEPKFDNEVKSAFIRMKHFIRSNVSRCIFIKVNVSLPSPGASSKQ